MLDNSISRLYALKKTGQKITAHKIPKTVQNGTTTFTLKKKKKECFLWKIK